MIEIINIFQQQLILIRVNCAEFAQTVFDMAGGVVGSILTIVSNKNISHFQ